MRNQYEPSFEDVFNLLCGQMIGEGVHRQVFECKLDQTLVVKVENSDYLDFANVREWTNWDETQFFKPAARWLAPCVKLGTNGRVLLQKRVQPLRDNELPPKLPKFIFDRKRENLGLYEGRVVCCDYPQLGNRLEMQMTKAELRD